VKQSTAVDILNHLMITIQKLRSNERESIEHFRGTQRVKDAVLESLQPWIYGDRCLLPGLEKTLSPGHYLTPQEFYNFMFIVDRFVPEIGIMTAVRQEEDFPAPDVNWIRGWEQE
jgi:hypothetical protein